MSRLLVTGLSGFVGTNLRHMAAAGLFADVGEIVGVGDVDICSFQDLADSLSTIRPEFILHLAGVSSVSESFLDPDKVYQVNFVGVVNLLRACDQIDFQGRLLFVSSGDVYGEIPAERLPVTEDTLPRPRSPYAVSKIAAEALCCQHGQTSAYQIVIARPFNHIGAHQSPSFAISNFAKQVSLIKAGQAPPRLAVGNIDVSRDFLDVRDVVRAYATLLTRGRPGEIYNICSGKERTIREMLMELLDIASLKVEITLDPTRCRNREQQRVVGSHEKISSHTGWHPQSPLREGLGNALAYWEENLTAGLVR